MVKMTSCMSAAGLCPAMSFTPIYGLSMHENSTRRPYFAEIAAEGENVVVASAATFGNSIVDNGESFYLDERSVLYWDSPYPDLADVTDSGHINAMADTDGIIRHALLYVDSPEGDRVYSFARVIYEHWREENGTELNPLPEKAHLIK